MTEKMEKALRFVYERAEVLLAAPTDHARSVATMKLKDACLAVKREEKRRKKILRDLASAEE